MLGKKERTNNEQKRKQIVYFEVGKFYRNFSKMANVDKADCQIVYLKRIRGGSFEVCAQPRAINLTGGNPV